MKYTEDGANNFTHVLFPCNVMNKIRQFNFKMVTISVALREAVSNIQVGRKRTDYGVRNPIIQSYAQ